MSTPIPNNAHSTAWSVGACVRWTHNFLTYTLNPTSRRRVREMDENLSDLYAKESELMTKETELESLRLQLINQDEQERHSAQVRFDHLGVFTE